MITSVNQRLNTLAAHHFSDAPVLLAGSYATGNPTKDSDVDLLVFTDKVHTPIITCRKLMGFKVEYIEIPASNALYFLEKTSYESGAYIFMLATGCVLQDNNGYLHHLKKWGEKRFLAGPPQEGKNRKIYRQLIDLTRLIEDLEGDKLGIEKAVIANELIYKLMRLLLLSNDLWPMNGKWVHRVLEPLYKGLSQKLLTQYQKAIGTRDYSKLLAEVDACISPLGGRTNEYSTFPISDEKLENDKVQIIVPGIYLMELEQAEVERLEKLYSRFPKMYLKSFDGMKGSLGFVFPDILSEKPEKLLTIINELELGNSARFAAEPTIDIVYGGKEAYGVAEDYFILVTQTAFKLYRYSSERPERGEVITIGVYLYTIFCSISLIERKNISNFSSFLSYKWISSAVNSGLPLNHNDTKIKIEQFESKIKDKVSKTDIELKKMISEILYSPDIYFDETLFDDWKGGLEQIFFRLRKMTTNEWQLNSKFQLLTKVPQDKIQKETLFWPIMEQYLIFLFDILDIDHKDRLYLIHLVSTVCKSNRNTAA